MPPASYDRLYAAAGGQRGGISAYVRALIARDLAERAGNAQPAAAGAAPAPPPAAE